MSGHHRLAGLLQDAPGQTAVGSMPWLHGHDVPAQRRANEAEVANDVEYLVPHELLAVTHRLSRQHGVFTNDDGVLEATTADQAVFDQELNFLVKTERSRVGDLAFPRLGRQLDAEKLGEASALVGAGAGDFEAVEREGVHHRFLVRVFDRLGDDDRLGLFRLRLDAGLVDHPAELPGTAVGDGWFVGIDLDDRVGDTKTGQRCEDMLHRLHLGLATGKGCRAGGFRDVLDLGRDLRAAVEVDTAKEDPRVGRCGQQGHGDLVSTVQADAGKARRPGQCLLLQHGAH